jgi:hypothetical protein
VYHKLIDNLGLFHELQVRGCATNLPFGVGLSRRCASQGPVYPPRARSQPPPLGLQHFTTAGGVDVLGLDAPSWPTDEE